MTSGHSGGWQAQLQPGLHRIGPRLFAAVAPAGGGGGRSAAPLGVGATEAPEPGSSVAAHYRRAGLGPALQANRQGERNAGITAGAARLCSGSTPSQEGRATTMPQRAGRAVRPAGGRGDLTYRPGSDGERVLRDRLGTTQRARRFYATQVTAGLTPAMRQFTGRMEMAFTATS